jgi:hypothetical protein
MNEVKRLQQWFKSQCDGDWEHRKAISIESCDNPGWWVKIDLQGTKLESKSFTPVERNVSLEQMDRIAKGIELDICDRGNDWMLCQVKNNLYDAAGDPEKLQRILEIFLDWANE